MRRTTGRHLCLLLLFFPFSWAEDTKNDVKSNNVTVLGPAETRRLFAKHKISSGKQTHIIRGKSYIMAPARRCGRLMESCSTHLLCCDPCASCRCRLFNTICHCWRINPLCLKRT